MPNERHKIITYSMLTGPGPGRYILPRTVGYDEHDFTRLRNPAYSFGTKNGTFYDHQMHSPGPKYSVNTKFTRNGKDGYPAYTMAGKGRDLIIPGIPGPGAYAPEKFKFPSSKEPPAYSLASRFKTRGLDRSPGPNAYVIPPLIGGKGLTKPDCPKYSLRAKLYQGSFCQDLANTPGPCYYDPVSPDKTKQKLPEYTAVGRNFIPDSNLRIPGPGAYYPHYKSTKAEAPAFTMGIRHSQFTATYAGDVPEGEDLIG